MIGTQGSLENLEQLNKEAMLPHGCYFMVMNSGTNQWFLVIAIYVYVGGGSQDVVEILRVGLLIAIVGGGSFEKKKTPNKWCNVCCCFI